MALSTPSTASTASRKKELAKSGLPALAKLRGGNSALSLAAQVVVQPGKVDVEVVKLGLVVHKYAQLVRLHAVDIAQRLRPLRKYVP